MLFFGEHFRSAIFLAHHRPIRQHGDAFFVRWPALVIIYGISEHFVLHLDVAVKPRPVDRRTDISFHALRC